MHAIADSRGLDRYVRFVRIVLMLITLATAAHAERLRAPDGTIRDVPSDSVPYALGSGYTRLDRVPVRMPDGSVLEAAEDEVGYWIAKGGWKMSDQEYGDWLAKRQNDADEKWERERQEEQANKTAETVWAFVGVALLVGGAIIWAKRRGRPE